MIVMTVLSQDYSLDTNFSQSIFECESSSNRFHLLQVLCNFLPKTLQKGIRAPGLLLGEPHERNVA